MSDADMAKNDSEDIKKTATNKRGDSPDMLRRQLYIYHYLQEGAKTISEIEAYLQTLEIRTVTKRTLQRNLRDMEDSFGVYHKNKGGTKGKPSIWAIDYKMFKNPFAYSPDVAMALALSYQQIKMNVPADIVEKVDPIFKQAISQLEQSQSVQAKWVKCVTVSPASFMLPPAKVKPEIAKHLTECALNQEVVEITYRTSHVGNESIISGTALGIHYRGNVAYLLLRPLQRNNVRQFPFSRIYKVKQLITATPETNDFNINELSRSGSLTMTYGPPFKLEAIIFDSVRREIEDAPIGADQVLTKHGDDPLYSKLNVTVPYNLDMIQWLFARSPYLKVLGPLSFKEKFEEELRRAWQNVELDSPQVPKEKNFKHDN